MCNVQKCKRYGIEWFYVKKILIFVIFFAEPLYKCFFFQRLKEFLIKKYRRFLMCQFIVLFNYYKYILFSFPIPLQVSMFLEKICAPTKIYSVTPL